MVFDEVISPARHGMEGATHGNVITTITPQAGEGREWRVGAPECKT